MRTVYEATASHLRDRNDYSTYWQETKEFDSMPAAIAFVEAESQKPTMCGGKVITWAVTANLPYCQPAERYNSCALRTWERETGWKDQNIFY